MVCGAPGTAPCPLWEFQAAGLLGVVFLVLLGALVLIALHEAGRLGFVRPVRPGEDVNAHSARPEPVEAVEEQAA
ncbi:MAG: hypothetical protein DLM66_00080 [Candidatus Dormiibacter spiritus]|nr:MAG: hypothetical protein DLM66_00080 [Candidatus Dormibacteraeota bacterium]